MAVSQEVDLAALRWMRKALLDGTARAIRRDARISIPELAEHLGVAPATVSRWETRERVPRGVTARRYAAVLLELQTETS